MSTATKRFEKVKNTHLLTFLVGLVLVNLHILADLFNFYEQPPQAKISYETQHDDAENNEKDRTFQTSQVDQNLASSSVMGIRSPSASNSSYKYCKYEQANGHFESFNSSDPTGWQWVSDEKDCPIRDHLRALLDEPKRVKAPLTFLFLGDSQDFNSLKDICWMRRKRFRLPGPQPYPDTTPAALVNRAPRRKFNNRICVDNTNNVFFSFFKLYGMHHDCDNHGLRAQEESRITTSSADRIRRLLPVDLVSTLPGNTTYVVLVGSSLWDLSVGCNNQLGVTEEYQEQYRQGMLALHQAIQETLPIVSSIYWRTSPRITKEYDQHQTQQGQGKTRANQEILNQILRETVETHNLGVVVDWWAQVAKIPESILTKTAVQDDGQHYQIEPSMAFINMWLNTVFERDPSLLLEPTPTEKKAIAPNALAPAIAQSRESQEQQAGKAVRSTVETLAPTIQVPAGRSAKNLTCHSENAAGHFDSFERGPHSASWKWVSDHENCPITSYLDQILDGAAPKLQTPLSFLSIGDSLDFNTMNFVCQASRGRPARFRVQPQPTISTTNATTSEELINRARARLGNNGICQSDNLNGGGAVSFSFFKLYGMHHDCENSGYRVREESRETANSAERIRKLLPADILSALPRNTSYVVLLSSSLWDLSAGCNNQVGVTDEYKEMYRQGILALHEAVQETLPAGSPIYWRTGPRVTSEYDRQITKRGGGRTRGNQQTLNLLLRETVESHQLGTVVDWWAMSEKIPESVLTQAGVRPDGRHYKSEASLAFINMWLNAVFEQNPSLQVALPSEQKETNDS